MPEIKTVYLISHVHTDIGYADSQNVLLQSHSCIIKETSYRSKPNCVSQSRTNHLINRF